MNRRRMLVAHAGIAYRVSNVRYNARLIDEERPSHLHGFMHFLFYLFNLRFYSDLTLITIYERVECLFDYIFFFLIGENVLESNCSLFKCSIARFEHIHDVVLFMYSVSIHECGLHSNRKKICLIFFFILL